MGTLAWDGFTLTAVTVCFKGFMWKVLGCRPDSVHSALPITGLLCVRLWELCEWLCHRVRIVYHRSCLPFGNSSCHRHLPCHLSWESVHWIWRAVPHLQMNLLLYGHDAKLAAPPRHPCTVRTQKPSNMLLCISSSSCSLIFACWISFHIDSFEFHHVKLSTWPAVSFSSDVQKGTACVLMYCQNFTELVSAFQYHMLMGCLFMNW
jgi:hypothetical protein